MASWNNIFSFFLFLLLLLPGRGESWVENDYEAPKLFVFGDSYVDTGNTIAGEPNGITYPGKPDGRHSDGRIFTDFLANYLGLKSPVPYELRKLMMVQDLKYGMNFAFSGTGVFSNTSSNPNMTMQINFLEKVIRDKLFSGLDLNNSVAYVSSTGNDYVYYYFSENGTDFLPYIDSVIKQIITNLIHIQRIGVKKIVVSSLHSLHCDPIFTISDSFQQCNSTIHKLVVLHNKLLNEAVTKLNQERKLHIQILDLYDSFMSVINNPSMYNIQNPLRPCCDGVTKGYYCGTVVNNEKKYVVCDKPGSAFFFDSLHPTQAGWHALFNKLQDVGILNQIFYEGNGKASY
ncbi:unnamed protein product [Lupinus luteus]|uniref:GDSL esterase/lipase n=1 Tax=Lupinus luteus TaxID=3873 RepID=A0AAV1VQ96_LUPLU